MGRLFDATLWIHIVAGFLALFAGGGALATKKGGYRHRRLGRVFVYAMAVVAVTALALLAIEVTPSHIFLGFVAIFSYYFAFSGYRVLSQKRPADDPAHLDWLALALLLGSGVGLVALGGTWWLDGNGFALVVVIFGAIALATGVGDLRRFSSPTDDRREWFFEHLTRMGAAYIATVSAFSAVNFFFLPGVVRWLWPTILGTPLLVYLSRRYRQQFAGPSAASTD